MARNEPLLVAPTVACLVSSNPCTALLPGRRVDTFTPMTSPLNAWSTLDDSLPRSGAVEGTVASTKTCGGVPGLTSVSISGGGWQYSSPSVAGEPLPVPCDI